MRALILSSSPESTEALASLFDDVTLAGPGFPDAQTLDGTWLSLRTPAGEFELEELLAKLPVHHRPDVVAALVDPSWRNRPCNVAAFAGPKVLVVARPFPEGAAFHSLNDYAASENFDRIVALTQCDHAEVHSWLASQFVTAASPVRVA